MKLVVFFSHTGENYNVGVIEKGNTHIVADMIAEGTDRKIAETCKGAETAVGKGLAIQGKVAQENRKSAHSSVEAWLYKLGVSK